MADELLVECHDTSDCSTSLIRGGRVIDGTGNPWFHADVGVRGDRIVAVGPVDEPARRTIECDGLVLRPGSPTCTPTPTCSRWPTRRTR